MGVMSDFCNILFNCIAQFKQDEFIAFLITLAVGILLGAGSWFLCNYYSRLWNVRFRVTLTHQLLCAVAAILTVIFTLTFVSLKYTKDIAYSTIAVWQQQIKSDSGWNAQTFRKSYEKVKALGVEDFSRYPHPNEGGRLMPLSKSESRQINATVYATEAILHFKHSHPYLALILRAQPDISIQVISADTDHYFATHPGGIYSAGDAVDLAAKYIKSGLDAQVPRIVTVSRTLIVILFLFVQAIPLGLIGWAAYKDVKVIS
jgi:hypothetical protein